MYPPDAAHKLWEGSSRRTRFMITIVLRTLNFCVDIRLVPFAAIVGMVIKGSHFQKSPVQAHAFKGLLRSLARAY